MGATYASIYLCQQLQSILPRNALEFHVVRSLFVLDRRATFSASSCSSGSFLSEGNERCVAPMLEHGARQQGLMACPLPRKHLSQRQGPGPPPGPVAPCQAWRECVLLQQELEALPEHDAHRQARRPLRQLPCWRLLGVLPGSTCWNSTSFFSLVKLMMSQRVESAGA